MEPVQPGTGRPSGRPPSPELTSVEAAVDGFLSRTVGAWKKILIITVGLLIFWGLVVPNLLNYLQYVMYGMFMLFQLMFAVLFMIVQFAALFWFLGRGRTYWVMPGETGVGFADYRGNPEVLEVARRIVTLLQGVKEFKQMGGEVTRGLLLVGPPGTGKSYLAQCISTEARVPFGYCSAPSFQAMFMGIGNLRVMMLYNKARKLARKHGACILFIDEIDAIGMARSSSMGGGMPMMGGMMGGGTGLLNELLQQMDPPPSDQGQSLKIRLMRKLGLRRGKAIMPPVLTMGATNLAETLDKALLRPGRFDRRITVDLPDFDGRKEIIEYYLNKVSHDPISLDKFAYDTIGYSPVAIKFVINEAVINAHFAGRKAITYADITSAREVHEWGLRQPIKNMTIEDKRLLAYHEVGHAIAQYRLLPSLGERFAKVTIIRHGQALGLSAWRPDVERHVREKQFILAHIRISLASRAAEELFLGQQSTGVTSDFAGATQMAGAMIGYYGMNGSFVSALGLGQAPADAGARREIDRILKEQYREVRKLLEENWEECIAVAEILLRNLELDHDEVDEIVKEVERRRQLGLPLMRIPPIDADPVTWEDVDTGRVPWVAREPAHLLDLPVAAAFSAGRSLSGRSASMAAGRGPSSRPPTVSNADSKPVS
jgi:cell division protease FtsH